MSKNLHVALRLARPHSEFYRRCGYISSSAPTFGEAAEAEEIALPLVLLLNKTLLK